MLLNDRQRVDYEEHRRAWIQWLLQRGKDTARCEGYAETTVEGRANRGDQWCRWVWVDYRGSDDSEVDYTVALSHRHADAYIEYLLTETQYGNDHIANTKKALKSWFKWQSCERDGQRWDPSLNVTNPPSSTTGRDYVTETERRKLREAALEYDSIPHYNSVTPEQRKRWSAYLAKKFSKPIENVGPTDWEHVQGWKIPSLVWTTLDAGLRPVEVQRATTSWVDVDSSVLRIPRRDAAKNQRAWEIAVTDRTARALEEWREERPQYTEYRETDSLWLTREGNPYSSQGLSRLLGRLCEVAGIPTANRDISWYSLRRGMVTAIIDKSDVSTAQVQARHEDPRSTLRYDQAPSDRRRDVLEDIG